MRFYEKPQTPRGVWGFIANGVYLMPLVPFGCGFTIRAPGR